ncbi:MAG: SatD family protein [Eubacteriales bacterium]
MNYVSLIIDIEKSKNYHINERNEMQYYMDECINKLNVLFEKQMKFQMTFSAGDEIQGLFTDVTVALIYFRIIEMLMKPVKLRAGIGIGDWNIKIEGGASTQQDGPAYHKARLAIEEVSKSKLHNVRIYSQGNDILANHLLNASLPLRRQQVYMQNIIQAILELLFPFVTNEMDFSDFRIINDLLSIKYEYRLGSKNRGAYSKRSPLLEKQTINVLDITSVSPIYIDGNLEEVDSKITGKYAANIIAEIFQCTRQNVASIISRGNINKIRELDYMALQFVKHTYGDNEWNY